MRLRPLAVAILVAAALVPVVLEVASPSGTIRRTAAWREARRWNDRLHRWGVRSGLLHCPLCERPRSAP